MLVIALDFFCELSLFLISEETVGFQQNYSDGPKKKSQCSSIDSVSPVLEV